MCSGYYKYEEGYTPEFSGRENFAGRIVHPQKWPEDIDYAGKRVGGDRLGGDRGDAGAGDGQDGRPCHHAAALADLCGARPAETRSPTSCAQRLPSKLAFHLIRWRNVLWGMYFFQLSRRKPDRVKQLILGGVRMALGRDYDIATHFTPRYNPGISGSAWCRRRPVQGDQGKARLRRYQGNRCFYEERYPAEGRQ